LGRNADRIAGASSAASGAEEGIDDMFVHPELKDHELADVVLGAEGVKEL
jgi:hypothetical protein